MNRPDSLIPPAAGISLDRSSQPAHDHVVHFYENKDTLYRTAGAFLAEGLHAGEPALVIATQEHGDAIRFQLASLGVDVNTVYRSGQLWMLDAHETLETFMRDGMPDKELFRSHVGAAVLHARASQHGLRVRAFGEMVDVLWTRGSTAAAIRLEELWNDLLAEHDCALLCAYAMGSFYHSTREHGLDDVCRQHARVVSIESDAQLSDDLVAAEETRLLRQRTDALEQEVDQRKILERALRDALAQRRRAEEALQRDIEQRKLTEAELLRAKEEAERANRVKAEFLAVMSHELRTPLNAIIGYEQLLTEGIVGPATDSQRECLMRIRTSAQHLLSLIDDVLHVVRIESGTNRYDISDVLLADVLRMVKQIVQPQIAKSGLQFSWDVDESLVVRADVEKLQQILINLIGNAVKFTPAPGEVSLHAAAESPTATTAEIRVSDTGPGIPLDKQESIFDRFVQLDGTMTRAQNGLGLGLAISRDLARGMNGTLAVESVPGSGATFVLRLPRAPRIR